MLTQIVFVLIINGVNLFYKRWKMKIITGPWVSGDTFFGREREIRNITEALKNPKIGIFIPGPRRTGKTSLVMESIRRNQSEYKFIYFDLEGRNSVIELCRDLIGKLQKEHPDIVKSNKFKVLRTQLVERFPEIEILKVKIKSKNLNEKDFMQQMESIFELLNQHNFIFAFDEFSDFLWKLNQTATADVINFLAWLRRLRQESKIKCIITGSINIMSTAEELNVTDLLNDLTDIEIFPLTSDEIKQFLTQLLAPLNITLNADAMDYVLYRLSDGIPFFIQLFASGLQSYRTNEQQYDLVKIQEIYERITDKQHKEFIDLHSRLKDYLSPGNLKAAQKILAHLSMGAMSFFDLKPYVKDFVTDDHQLQKLLKRLIDENYLKKQKQLYRFASPMLSDWWRNSYEWER